MENKTISQKINAYLSEPEGAQFEDGKWRFWAIFVFGLSLGSSTVTALIYSGSIGAVAAAMGLLLLWVFVGTLHYSGSKDAQLARGVSLLDSISLCFVIAHFCFVLWVYGHLLTLRGAELRYEIEVAAYNAKAGDLSKDNVQIARSIENASANNVKTARLNNDAAYQLRRAVESGGPVKRGPAAPAAADSLPSLNQIKLPEPKAPGQSSVDYLNKWDSLVRLANFGELILAAATLIYIRNRSAKSNSGGARSVAGQDGPVATVSLRPLPSAAPLRQGNHKKATDVATGDRREKLNILREHLREIAFYIPNRFFKADLIQGGVSIRICRKVLGADVTVKTTRQSDRLLNAVHQPDFRQRLIEELKYQNFPIGKGSEND